MSKPVIQLEIHIPTSGGKPEVGFYHAYAKALCEEMEAVREDLLDYQIETLYIYGGGYLSDQDLTIVLRKLHKIFDLSGTEKIVDITPERLSSALLTTYRNFYMSLYRLDLGSLNYVDFQRLGRSYSYQLHGWLKQLFCFFDMKNICPVLSCGLTGQTIVSLEDSLNRVLEFSPDVVTILPTGTEVQDDIDVTEKFTFSREYLLRKGYRRVSLYEYSRPDRKNRRVALQQRNAEYWGIGLGAVSFLDGCMIQNTGDADVYILHAGETEQVIKNMVRLDSDSQMKSYCLHALQNPDGLLVEDFEKQFGLSMQPQFDELVFEGYASKRNGRIFLTDDGAVHSAQTQKLLYSL